MISRDKTEMLLHTRTHSFASNLVNSKLEFVAIHALGKNISQIVSILHKLRQNVFSSSEFLNPLPSKVKTSLQLAVRTCTILELCMSQLRLTF